MFLKSFQQISIQMIKFNVINYKKKNNNLRTLAVNNGRLVEVTTVKKILNYSDWLSAVYEGVQENPRLAIFRLLYELN